MASYEQEKYPVAETLTPVQMSTRDRLLRDKKHLEDRLADINKALQLLSENPVLEEFQDVMRRI